jgi:hypothetical protein
VTPPEETHGCLSPTHWATTRHQLALYLVHEVEQRELLLPRGLEPAAAHPATLTSMGYPDDRRYGG